MLFFYEALLCKYAESIYGIRFSIDGATKETYEKIRTPGKFDKLINNLELFKEVNKDKRYFKRVTMDSIVSTDVQSELAYHLFFYSQYTEMVNIGLHLMNGLSLNNEYFFNNSVLKKHIVKNHPCMQLNGNIHILCDGSVTACCRDYNGELIFGSIKNDCPENLINNEKIVQLRKAHISKQSLGTLCDNCYAVDPIVSQLFSLFVRTLILRNSDTWNVDNMQKIFNRFFELFHDSVPDVKEYLSLFR